MRYADLQRLVDFFESNELIAARMYSLIGTKDAYAYRKCVDLNVEITNRLSRLTPFISLEHVQVLLGSQKALHALVKFAKMDADPIDLQSPAYVAMWQPLGASREPAVPGVEGCRRTLLDYWILDAV